MTQLLFPNGNDVTHTTKEAVASAILYQTYDRLRGAGPTGRIIYREKPCGSFTRNIFCREGNPHLSP